MFLSARLDLLSGFCLFTQHAALPHDSFAVACLQNVKRLKCLSATVIICIHLMSNIEASQDRLYSCNLLVDFRDNIKYVSFDALHLKPWVHCMFFYIFFSAARAHVQLNICLYLLHLSFLCLLLPSCSCHSADPETTEEEGTMPLNRPDSENIYSLFIMST